MKRIISIVAVDKRVDKSGKVYYVTTARLDDGEEYHGFGRDFKEGDEVENWYDTKWDQPKFRLRPDR